MMAFRSAFVEHRLPLTAQCRCLHAWRFRLASKLSRILEGGAATAMQAIEDRGREMPLCEDKKVEPTPLAVVDSCRFSLDRRL